MVSATMRLFFAIMLPDEARNAVAQVQANLRDGMGAEGIRWTLPEQWHITLKFLGETDESRLDAVIESAREIATRFAPFALTIGKVSVFPSQRSPQTLWLGIESELRNGVPVLNSLAESLNSELEKAGFEREAKRFSPHLTLARTKTRDGETSVAKNLPRREENIEKFASVAVILVDVFVLVCSKLNPQGSDYTILESFPLSPPPL